MHTCWCQDHIYFDTNLQAARVLVTVNRVMAYFMNIQGAASKRHHEGRGGLAAILDVVLREQWEMPT